MVHHWDAWILSEDGEDMSRLEAACGEFLLIALVDGVDKAAIPLGLSIEIIAERSVDKWLDHIGEGYENIEMKILEQERQDVLRSDALESVDGAVVVEVHFLITLELPIESVGRRELSPEFVHDMECLGPALVSIAAHQF